MNPRTRDTLGFFAAALAGFAVWAASAPVAKSREPWDGNPAAYLAVLLLIGLVVTWTSGGRVRSPYLGAVLGQVVFGIVPAIGCPAWGWMCGWEADLAPLSLIALLAYSLPALGGSALAHWLITRRSI
ncbi:MAG: hypothetical protein U1E56_09685 [Bauldia sp.]